MRVSILRAPGPPCAEVFAGLTRALGEPPLLLDEAELEASEPLGSLSAVVVAAAPGAQSEAPGLSAGAVGTLRAFVKQGGALLGVCGGVGPLCAAGLLPGTLRADPGLWFEAQSLHVRVEGRPTPFSWALPAGRVLPLPQAHGPGRWEHAEPAALTARGQVILRYCDAAAGLKAAARPPGAEHDVAAVSDESGRVLGLLAHPGPGAEPPWADEFWRQLFGSLRLHRRLADR
jgi:phosphoribosylformylglycinamidine synthase subunit PurQ / glutaminase